MIFLRPTDGRFMGGASVVIACGPRGGVVIIWSPILERDSRSDLVRFAVEGRRGSSGAGMVSVFLLRIVEMRLKPFLSLR